MGFTEILTIIFILLKVFDIVNWNWFIVLLPEIIALVVYVVILVRMSITYRKLNKEFNKFTKDDD
jgi:hypothetical protein